MTKQNLFGRLQSKDFAKPKHHFNKGELWSVTPTNGFCHNVQCLPHNSAVQNGFQNELSVAVHGPTGCVSEILKAHKMGKITM